MSCPGCSHPQSTPHSKVDNVVTCAGCGGIYTLSPIYRGESYQIVLPSWDEGEAAEEVYYDLTVLGSDGIQRRHGWFNPATKQITQTG